MPRLLKVDHNEQGLVGTTFDGEVVKLLPPTPQLLSCSRPDSGNRVTGLEELAKQTIVEGGADAFFHFGTMYAPADSIGIFMPYNEYHRRA